MKKATLKVLSLALAAVFVVSSAPVMNAKAAVSAPTSVNRYLLSKTGDMYLTFYVDGMKKDQKVKDFKSSKKSIIKPYKIQYNHTANSWSEQIIGGTTSGNSYSNYNAELTVLCSPEGGKADITYTIGSKKYKTAVQTKKYVNPMDSITMTNVNSGKNFASKTKNSCGAYDLKINKSTSSPSLKAKTTSKFKFTYFIFENRTKGITVRQSFSSPVSAFNIKLPAYSKNDKIGVDFGSYDSAYFSNYSHYSNY